MDTAVFYSDLAYHDNSISHLSYAERQRAEKYTNPQRQQLYLLGRELLRQGLRFVGAESNYELNYSKNGKPELVSPQPWCMNLTHSDTHLFLVLRRHHTVGIDSEVMRIRNYQRLANKCFSAVEIKAIKHAKDPCQAFYQAWTTYEAQIKFLGLSVFHSLPKCTDYFTASFQYESLVLSLCSGQPFDSIDFYHHHPKKPEPFMVFYPSRLT